jgi:hypothetical protein
MRMTGHVIGLLKEYRRELTYRAVIAYLERQPE